MTCWCASSSANPSPSPGPSPNPNLSALPALYLAYTSRISRVYLPCISPYQVRIFLSALPLLMIIVIAPTKLLPLVVMVTSIEHTLTLTLTLTPLP